MLWLVGMSHSLPQGRTQGSLRRASLTVEARPTIICEVKAFINCRPLTHIEDNPEEGVPLKPSHFLIGQHALSMPQELTVNETSTTTAEKQRRARYHPRLTKELWPSWRNTYLLLLHSAHRRRPAVLPKLKVHDTMIMHEDKGPPIQWKLGRVTALHHGANCISRGCAVRLATGQVVNRQMRNLTCWKQPPGLGYHGKMYKKNTWSQRP